MSLDAICTWRRLKNISVKLARWKFKVIYLNNVLEIQMSFCSFLFWLSFFSSIFLSEETFLFFSFFFSLTVTSYILAIFLLNPNFIEKNRKAMKELYLSYLFFFLCYFQYKFWKVFLAKKISCMLKMDNME